MKEAFTPKVKKSWIKVYGVLEAQMKIGMKQYESELKAKANAASNQIEENSHQENGHLQIGNAIVET